MTVEAPVFLIQENVIIFIILSVYLALMKQNNVILQHCLF